MHHIITIHHNQEKWLALQLKHLEMFASECKIWAYANGIHNFKKYKQHFHFLEKSGKLELKPCNPSSIGSRNHWTKLDKLTNLVLDTEAEDEDVLVWLDSDSLLLKPLEEYTALKLQDYNFIAVQRPENNGDLIPHPSFAFCKAKFWRDNSLTWRGEVRNISQGRLDSGGFLLNFFNENHENWFKMLRTKSLTEHDLWFTIYDNFVYHHGAGSRQRACRAGNKNLKFNEQEMFNMISQRKGYEDFYWGDFID